MKTDPTRFAAFSPFSPLNNLRRRLKIAAARAFMYRSSVLPYASEMWYPRLPISITEVKKASVEGVSGAPHIVCLQNSLECVIEVSKRGIFDCLYMHDKSV